MISQAGTQAIAPSGTWGPPLEKVKDSSAFLRIATEQDQLEVALKMRVRNDLLTPIERIKANRFFDEAIQDR